MGPTTRRDSLHETGPAGTLVCASREQIFLRHELCGRIARADNELNSVSLIDSTFVEVNLTTERAAGHRQSVLRMV